jgi:hypothetical protein
MKFIISVIDSQTRSPHSAEEMQAIDDLNVDMQSAGQRLFAGGIDSPSTAFVFDARGGEAEVTPGAFHIGNEFFSGIWIIEVETLEEAKALAIRGSIACNRKVELRPLLG